MKARPREGRCEVPGRPAFDFSMVVHVPDTALYAAGHTFVLASAELSKPPTSSLCAPPCLTLPALGNVTGAYQVTSAVAKRVGYELPDGQSIPVRATYVPVGPDASATFDAALPLEVLFASSRIVDLDRPTIAYLRSLPVGRWTRVFEPQPPFEKAFPPRIDQVTLARGGAVFDLVEIGGASGGLDDETGTSRDAVVTRAEGLDGFRVWLEDHATGRRISTLQTLGPKTEERPRLDTTGRGSSLEGVDAIVAPPASWIGVPLLRTPLIGGSGLSSLAYPTLRVPIALEGLVAGGESRSALLPVAARVTFESASIFLPNGNAQPLLRYATTVFTDGRGRFATVVPPGIYDVTIEPAEDSPFASMRSQVVIDDGAPLTLIPPRRTRVHGFAQLTDGRALARAEVLATPEPLVDGSAQPTPRPGRARADESGAFELDLDQGRYVLTVVPEAGTGFPRLVTRATIPLGDADVGVLRVPPPTRLDLQFRDPSNLARPIGGARVRIFARPEGASDGTSGPALEIGTGLTSEDGRVEILLAREPR